MALGAVSPKTVTTTVIGATYVPDLNPQLLNRVVGYYEYKQALNLLGSFVRSASADELAVAEGLVAGRDEFTIFTNLSRRLEAGSNPLSERSDVSSDTFARSGLAWIMGLARVELTAMIAGFSGDPNPVATNPPSPYEVHAYRELLQDAMRTHYWSLYRDPAPRAMRRGVTPEPQAIAYVRRATLALKFLRAVRSGQTGQLTTEQQRELDTWEQQLRGLQAALLYDVLGVHDAIVSKNTNTSQIEVDLHKCGTTREAILDDIRSGMAKVNGASPAALAALEKDLKNSSPIAGSAPSSSIGSSGTTGAAGSAPAGNAGAPTVTPPKKP